MKKNSSSYITRKANGIGWNTLRESKLESAQVPFWLLQGTKLVVVVLVTVSVLLLVGKGWNKLRSREQTVLEDEVERVLEWMNGLVDYSPRVNDENYHNLEVEVVAKEERGRTGFPESFPPSRSFGYIKAIII